MTDKDLATQIAILNTQFETFTKTMDGHTAKLDHLLHGDGNGMPGIIKDVDRLKQKAQHYEGQVRERRTHRWIVYGAGITTVMGWAAHAAGLLGK